jgi:hypothetical protein
MRESEAGKYIHEKDDLTARDSRLSFHRNIKNLLNHTIQIYQRLMITGHTSIIFSGLLFLNT